MLKPLVSRAALAASLLVIAACSQAPRETNARLTDPLPPPGPISSGGQVAPQFAPAPTNGSDIVLRGAAYAESGDGRFPPNSRMTVRVYDAAVGDVNDWAAEQSYSRSGALPWPYEMRFRTEALNGIARPVLAARIEGPDGRLVYQSDRAVPLVEGGSEDIPLVSVAGGGVVLGTPADGQYIGAPVQQGPAQRYGIPDPNVGYGAPNYSNPVYSGQSFESTTFSGPPSNGTF